VIAEQCVNIESTQRGLQHRDDIEDTAHDSDGDELEDFVEDLRNFNDCLMNLVPALEDFAKH
jgi:hypothetical protein